MTRTAAIVVNYNGAEDTRRCVESLAKSVPSPTLVLVDNGSENTDGLEEAIVDYAGAELLYAPNNIGFGRGNNLGIRWALSHTDCEYFFLLNNDAMVEPSTIKDLERALVQHERAGVSAARIVVADEPNLLWYGSGEIDWRKGVARVPGYMGSANADHALVAKDVGFASGCAMLVRRTVLEEVGGFDPRFFMYEEDLELCLRIQESGWTIRYVPESLVLHKCQGSTRGKEAAFVGMDSLKNTRLPYYVLHRTKNRLLNMVIHARGTNALRFVLFFPMYLTLKCVQFVFARRWDAVQATLSGLLEFALEFRKPFVDELK